MDRFEVKVVPDLEFAKPGGKPLLLDLYLPMETGRSLPIIVWLHGGGWRIGDRKLGPDFYTRFAERGFAMASMEYRLSGEAIFPAQIHDVKAAIRWLRAHANDYGLDPGRIGLWGSSAGGHLAALAGLTGTGILEDFEMGCSEFISDVQVVVDGYGPIDFFQLDDHDSIKSSDDIESLKVGTIQRHTDSDSPESQFLGAPIESVPHLVRDANPLNYVKHGAPPFLIIHGLNDTAVHYHQSELLYKGLIEQGNQATLCLIEGMGHAFFNNHDLDVTSLSATIRTTESVEAEHLEHRQIKIFKTIEAFFCRHLLER